MNFPYAEDTPWLDHELLGSLYFDCCYVWIGEEKLVAATLYEGRIAEFGEFRFRLLERDVSLLAWYAVPDTTIGRLYEFQFKLKLIPYYSYWGLLKFFYKMGWLDFPESREPTFADLKLPWRK